MEVGIFIGSVVYDEVIDISDISALIILSGTKRYRRVIQRVGRALRPKAGLNEVLVFDFWDTTHWILRHHSEERVKVYQHSDLRYKVIDLETLNKTLGKPLLLEGINCV